MADMSLARVSKLLSPELRDRGMVERVQDWGEERRRGSWGALVQLLESAYDVLVGC
jgi:hypothetical protein